MMKTSQTTNEFMIALLIFPAYFQKKIKMAQQLRSTWLKTILEQSNLEESINNSTSINFQRIIQPEISSITMTGN